jgi:hypothetical protein
MADYKPPQYRPSADDLRNEYADQSESEKYAEKGRHIIRASSIDEHTVVLNCIAFLYQRNGVSELTEFMSYIKSSFGFVDDSKSQSKIYEFVKAIPAISAGKVGYTFKKKRGGLFLFLASK